MPSSNELAPPPLADETLRVIPLGGLGEIGRNMAVLEYEGRLLIIDCGVLFPEENQPGVDVIIPDFSSLIDRFAAVEAVVLTHGHEDHIGGIPYLLAAGLNAPLVGSQLTIGFIEAKLNEHRKLKPTFKIVNDREEVRFGPFNCTFVAVSHSIPDAMAVAVRTPAGTLFHTGDFKIDLAPLDGRVTDLAAFYAFGDQGVDLLLSDSTNAQVPGFVPMERDIGPVLTRVIGSAPGRVIVACTSSHVHRVQQVLDSAARNGRQVALVGRSMLRNMDIAENLGFLSPPRKTITTLAALDSLPAEMSVILCTGSQGEPMAALSRMAAGDHKSVKLTQDDTVIIASSLIPGNETAVYALMNRLAKLDIEVISSREKSIHVSGHAATGELLHALRALRPKNLMPVHGEPMHLRAHAKLGELVGMRRDQIVVARDGTVIDLRDGRATVVGHVQAGHVYVDGRDVGEVGEASLTDRRILRDEGFVSAILVYDPETGKVIAGPDVASRGFVDQPALLDRIQVQLAADVERYIMSAATTPESSDLQRVVRRSVGRQISDLHRRRPMIVAFVLEA